ncbi:hypothetical protein PtB15_8B724 [Puccinia triticina]|nr:hypothetical protein PtB15_8B724 [Puccinia triticina]
MIQGHQGDEEIQLADQRNKELIAEIKEQQLVEFGNNFVVCSLLNTALAPLRTTSVALQAPSTPLLPGSAGSLRARLASAPPAASTTPPPESFTLIPCRPSLSTQNGGDVSSAASHYGGASSTSISYDLPGWCAAVLSVLRLPEPAGNNLTTSRNETATEEAGGLIGRDERVLGLSLAYPSARPLTVLAQADHQLCPRGQKPAPAVQDIRASVRASSYWRPGP